MKTKVIHKRVDTCNTIIGAKAKCGILEFYIDKENLSWRWNKVTCKSCLKQGNKYELSNEIMEIISIWWNKKSEELKQKIKGEKN